MRADQLLLQRNIASSRSQAQRLIASGVRWRATSPVGAQVGVQAGAQTTGQSGVQNGGPSSSFSWKTIVKNSDELPHDAEFDLHDASEAKYVSRGGLKLEAALKSAGLAVAGKLCLDVGQSTGGFTDCLLQHGARQVVGVDVGSGQLHASLREHPQVVALENVNARHLDAQALDAALLIADYATDASTISTNSFGHVDDQPQTAAEEDEADDQRLTTRFDLIVGDLSFISQTLVLPALVPLLKPGADLLMLVKPQFELQPGQVGKGGIVKDVTLFPFVEQRIRTCCKELGLKVVGWFDSPITGGDGNREFFAHAVRVDPDRD